MTIMEKASSIPDGAAMTAGGTVSGFLVGMSLQDFQLIAGLIVAALTGIVLVQRIIINRRTLKAQKEGLITPGNRE